MKREWLAVMACFAIGCAESQHMQVSEPPATCRYWESKINPALPLEGPRLDELPDDGTAVTAISCLLRLRGNGRRARFGGVTRFDVSELAPPASVEVAALYYVSFIYEREWAHADAVVLTGPAGENTKRTVRAAFAAYGRWFSVVKKRGIEAARRDHYGPLNGTSLAWYGRRASP